MIPTSLLRPPCPEGVRTSAGGLVVNGAPHIQEAVESPWHVVPVGLEGHRLAWQFVQDPSGLCESLARYRQDHVCGGCHGSSYGAATSCEPDLVEAGCPPW